MAKRSGHHRRTHLDGLTQRQREVLEQMALGKTNLEIAETLGIGFESVKSHVSDILLRLDVTSREEAIIAWQDQHGVLSRLRRTATGFVLTGFGKAATAGVAVILAVGVTAAIFAMTGGGDDSDSKPPLDTYLLDDGREVNQALVEASHFYGFPIVAPKLEEYQLSWIEYRELDPRRPTVIRIVSTSLRHGPSQQSLLVTQVNSEFRADADVVLDSGQSDIAIARSGTSDVTAMGRGRGFTLQRIAGEISDEEGVRVMLALFDAAPGVLPPSTGGPSNMSATVTATPAGESLGLMSLMHPGLDFEVTTGDIHDVLQDASAEAGFEIALPSTLPAGMQVSRIRVPAAFANDDLRSAYISFAGDGDAASFVIAQHSREVVAPGSEWAEAIDTGRTDVRAWKFGERRDPQGGEQPPTTVMRSYMAVGHGRTVAALVVGGQLSEVDALAVLISTLESVP